MENYSAIFIDINSTIISAMVKMDDVRKKLLIVVENERYHGLISVGDIQRAILKNSDLNEPISSILRKDILVANPDMSTEEIKNLMLKIRAEFMPIITKDGAIVEILFWEDLFGDRSKVGYPNLNLPVVIMAGGKGTRLKPLTNVIPKPLIPISEKTIIEEIMDRFVNVGCKDFYLSINYKASTIISYFEELNNSKYRIEYFQEKIPLGTGGSLHLLKNKLTSTFFVTNCDIIIDQDLQEVYNYHLESKNDITIVSSLKQYSIPYGTIITGENGCLKEMTEKPNITYQINTGVYILEPHVLSYIPENEFFHITELIDLVIKNSGSVGVFPISEGAWNDIGEWNEYLKFINIYKN